MVQPASKGPSVARAISLLALQIALAYAKAGTHEEGGNNRGDQVEFFQKLMGGGPGDAWCADFVCACLVKGYARQHGLDESRQSLPGVVQAASKVLLPLSGYCPNLANAAREHYLLRSRYFTPVPGDLVLFDFEHKGEPHHVGIVKAADAFAIHTVEGNTSSGIAGSQADGDGVWERSRPVGASIFGFVHWG